VLTSQERRVSTRKNLQKLTYLSLQPDNGGIVLDISEGGLGFHVTAPVERSGPIYFWFYAGSSRIECTGELVWIDEAKKTGGLRFIQVPRKILDQIRNCPQDSDLRLEIGNEAAATLPSPEEKTPAQAIELRSDPVPSSPAIPVDQLPPDSFTFTRHGSHVSDREEYNPELFTSPLKDTYSDGQTSGLIKVMLSLALMVALVILAFAQRRAAGKALIWLGTKISGENNRQMASRTPPPEVSTSPSNPLASPMQQPAIQPSAIQQPAVQHPAIHNALPAAVSKTPPSKSAHPEHTPVTSHKGIVVQAGALQHEDEARELEKSLRLKKFPAYVQPPTTDKLYRVVIGPYGSEKLAEAAKAELMQAGYQGFIRH
jgi:hypothetical protein